jgi:hypothetical protein
LDFKRLQKFSKKLLQGFGTLIDSLSLRDTASGKLKTASLVEVVLISESKD